MSPQRHRGNTTDKVDRDLLHQYLWKKRDSLGRYLGTQTALADDLGVTLFTLSRIFKEMEGAGRLRKIRGKYYVVDPKAWAWQHHASS